MPGRRSKGKSMKTMKVRKHSFTNLILKGNLFPRVVLEDCASFKRKYGFLNQPRRKRDRDGMSDEGFDRPVTPPRSPTPPLPLGALDTGPQAGPSSFSSTSEFLAESMTSFFSGASRSAATTLPSRSVSGYNSHSSEHYQQESYPSTSGLNYTTSTVISLPSTSAVNYPLTSVITYPSAYPSTSTNNYPSVSDVVYPSTSSADYQTTSDENYPSTSSAIYPSTSATNYASALDGNYPSTSNAVFASTYETVSDSTSVPTSETPVESTSAAVDTVETYDDSTSDSTAGPSRGKKRRTWDPLSDYEIERIVGYHRDADEMMWYYVKWKGWGDDYNTYEPIENMTGCNYLLMKYFEYKKPTERQFARKDNEITESLETYDVYLKLQESNYKKEDLDEFSENCVNLTKMFKKGSFAQFCRMIQREYEYIIRCLIGMCSHQDPGLIRRAKNYKIALKIIKLRRKQLRENLAMQNYISSLEGTEVKVENTVDLEVFPQTFAYVVDLQLGENFVMPNDPTVGCDCQGGCGRKSRCCGEMASTCFAYNKYGRVRSLERFAIYECNRRCTCPPECPNRVVQRGLKVKLCIFKTELCGWGVKALEKIPKGTFICEYVGELITDAEAAVRDIEYYKKNLSYVFDLDYSPDHEKNLCCIDATKYGNLSRFVNHSCDPNLVVYPVWIDCLEPNLHRLAFFARRNIKKNEELSIDYENAQDGHRPKLSKEDEEKKSQRLRTLSRIRCQCGAPNCREWVFGN